MKKPYAFEKNGEYYTLQDCVEAYALCVAESLFKEEKRVEEIMQDCKILNSLSNALLSIKD